MMEQKAKFIIIGLIGVTIIIVFLFIQTLNSKQQLMKEKDALQSENASLNSKIKELDNSLRVNEKKLNSLNADLDKVSREKEEINKKYELVRKEKEELVEKLRTSQVRPQAPVPAALSLPQTADAYWAGILKAKTDLELQLDNLRNELRSAQINTEQLQREKSTLDLDLVTIKRDREDLKRQLEYNQKLMDSIAQELVRERTDKIHIQDSFKVIKNENYILTRQLKSLNRHKINLEKKLAALDEEKGKVERRFTEMDTMLANKISQIDDLKKELSAIRTSNQQDKIEEVVAAEKKEFVELPPIVVRPQGESSTGTAVASLEGKILAVNKENNYNFVVISLGEDRGIKIGDLFEVFRNGESIATIEVIQTRKSIAACDIKKEKSPIKVGDIVR